jgi:hypothetical protein
MYSPPSSPLSIGGVIDDGIRLFRVAFGRCWPLAVAPGVLLMLYELANPINLPVAGAGRTNPLQALAAVFSMRVFLLYLLALVFGLIFQGAVMVREIAIVRGDESFTLGQALGETVLRLPGLILGSILLFVILAAGFIALVIPGIWLSGRLQLWMPALFLENASATDALASSWRLTAGNWWRGAAIFTVAMIIILVLTMVFSFVAGVLAPMSHFTLSGRLLVAQLFSLVGNAISYPLLVAMWLAIYNDFKLRREGGDLASRARALGSTA